MSSPTKKELIQRAEALEARISQLQNELGNMAEELSRANSHALQAEAHLATAESQALDAETLTRMYETQLNYERDVVAELVSTVTVLAEQGAFMLSMFETINLAPDRFRQTLYNATYEITSPFEDMYAEGAFDPELIWHEIKQGREIAAQGGPDFYEMFTNVFGVEATEQEIPDDVPDHVANDEPDATTMIPDIDAYLDEDD